jgi:hypothetical protein
LPPEAPAAPPSCDARIAMKPEIREALEPTCCGSGCDDCPF